MTHTLQLVEPVTLWDLPAVHEVQTLTPASEYSLPVGQCWHVVDAVRPVSVEYIPAEQLVQAALPLAAWPPNAAVSAWVLPDRTSSLFSRCASKGRGLLSFVESAQSARPNAAVPVWVLPDGYTVHSPPFPKARAGARSISVSRRILLTAILPRASKLQACGPEGVRGKRRADEGAEFQAQCSERGRASAREGPEAFSGRVRPKEGVAPP